MHAVVNVLWLCENKPEHLRTCITATCHAKLQSFNNYKLLSDVQYTFLIVSGKNLMCFTLLEYVYLDRLCACWVMDNCCDGDYSNHNQRGGFKKGFNN